MIATSKDARPSQLSERVIDDMVIKWKAAKNTPGTINRKLTALSTLLKVAARRGVGPTALPKIEWQSEKGRQRERYYSREEEAKIIDWFERAERRYMAELVTFLLDTGCRLSEALQLTWRDVPTIQDGEPIRVWKVLTDQAAKGTKNHTSRTTFQTIRVAALLERRKAACPVGEARIFWEIPAGKAGVHHAEKQWEKMRAGIGMAAERDFCMHSCRHTWASRLTQAGIHPMVLKTLGGWGNLKLVERYSHLAPNAGRDIYSKLNT